MAQKFGNLGSYVPGEDEIIKTADLMTFGKSFARSNGQPLDESEVWYDLEALEAYALTNSAYVGQKVVYIDLENAKVYQYSIELDGTLKEIGTAPVGDGNTVTEVAAKDNTIAVESTQTKDGDGAVTNIKYDVAVKVSAEEGNAVSVKEDGLYVATPEAYDDTDVKASIKANADAIDAVDARVDTTNGNVTAIDGRLQTAEGEIDALQEQIKGLSGAMHFIGTEDAVPEDVTGYKSGDVIAVGDKEYVFNGTAFVEFGDISAEGERLTQAEEDIDAIEADISTINENLAKKADATQVSADISTAKQAAIDAAATDATTKANTAEQNAKDYADAELKKVSDAHGEDIAELNTAIETAATNAATDATTKANSAQAAAEATAASALSEAKTELQGSITAVDNKFADYTKTVDLVAEHEALDADIKANTAKFADYYTKTEVDTTVSGINTEVGKKADQTALDAVEGKVDALAQIKSVEESEFNITEAGKLEVKEVAQAKVTGLTTALAGKVDKVDGYGLLADSDKAKLDKLTLSGDDLTISGSVEAGSVNNLDIWITGNRDSFAGLFSTSNQTKLEGIADGAQVNVIEQVNLAGTKLEVNNKVVNINYGTADLAGVVKSATDMNTVAIKSDGTMEVNNISVEKLVVPEGTTFILNGGNA